MSNFSGCYKEIYPYSPLSPCPILMSFWYSWLWHNSLAGETQIIWSLKPFPRKRSNITKRVMFPGNVLNSPTVFLRKLFVCSLYAYPSTPQITQAKRDHKEFTFELFWTIFWQELKCSKLGAISHIRKVGISWLTSLSAIWALTLATANGIIAMSQIPAEYSDQGYLDLWESINTGPKEAYASWELFHWRTRTRFRFLESKEMSHILRSWTSSDR